jgi:hypothetical protein
MTRTYKYKTGSSFRQRLMQRDSLSLEEARLTSWWMSMALLKDMAVICLEKKTKALTGSLLASL